MYTLYHSPFSQHARRVVALLEEAALPYELRPVDMGAGEHMSEEFRKINPNHQVPVLVDGNFRLSESNAILRYLCSKHDVTDWYPTDIVARAIVEQWLDWNQCHLGPAVVDIVLNRVFLGANGDVSAIARGDKRVADVAPVLESALLLGPFVAGDAPTIADLSIASNCTQLRLANAMPATRAIAAWHQRISSLPGVEKACAPIRSMIRG